MAAVQGLKSRLDTAAIHYLEEMSRGRQERLSRARAGTLATLDGEWFGMDWSRLKREGAQIEYEHFLEEGALFHGYVPPSHWQHVEDRRSLTGRAICVFKLNEGMSPSEALHAQGPWVIDSRIAIEKARYLALEELLGRGKFDAIFASDGPAPLRLGERDPSRIPHPMFHLLNFREIESHYQVRSGEWICFMSGDGAYLKLPEVLNDVEEVFLEPLSMLKHPNSDWCNANALCQSSRWYKTASFRTFEYPPTVRTADEIVFQLLAHYNEPPGSIEDFVPPALQPTFLEKTRFYRRHVERLKDHTMTMRDFKTQGGGSVPSQFASSFNVRRIAQLEAAPTPAAARALMASWVNPPPQRAAPPVVSVECCLVW